MFCSVKFLFEHRLFNKYNSLKKTPLGLWVTLTFPWHWPHP